MRNIQLKFTAIFSIACICFLGSFAQDSSLRRNTFVQPPLFSGNSGFRVWSFGIHAGAMAPFNAAGGRNDFSQWKADLEYGAYLKYQISHALGF